MIQQFLGAQDTYLLIMQMLCVVYIEAMFASTSRKLGHLVHHYGGTAVGSFIEPDESPLKGSVTRAMFVDATHDNDPGHIQVEKYLLFVCLFVCLSVCLSVCLFVCLHACLSSVCLFACYLSACLFVCLFATMPFCLLQCHFACSHEVCGMLYPTLLWSP